MAQTLQIYESFSSKVDGRCRILKALIATHYEVQETSLSRALMEETRACYQTDKGYQVC